MIMLRERVDILGQVRPMEPKEEIEALKVPARLIGIIKEGPVKRWLTGQELWDKRFHKAALHTIQQREHYEKKYATVVEKARSQGLELVSDHHRPAEHRPRRASTMSNGTMFSTGEVDNDRRYGPFDLGEERPASSAIVGRRDNVSPPVFLMQTIACADRDFTAGVHRFGSEVHLLHGSSDPQERAEAYNCRRDTCGV